MGTRIAVSPRQRHRRGWLAVLAASVTLTTLLVGCGTGASPDNATATDSWPVRTVEVGAVTVKLQPRQLDAGGAVFEIVLDTHEVELDQDLARQSSLVVGDTPWPVREWTGDGPGGHHREGELRFAADGPVAGTVTLKIDGLPEPVNVTWDAGS